MDNIIEIIVFLFIIYSIFGSFFGKKKTQQKNNNRIPGNNPTEGVPKRTSSRQDNLETLEELFGFKLPRTEDPFPQQQSTKNSNSESNTWDPEKEFYTKLNVREKSTKKPVEKSIPNISFDKLNPIELRKKKQIVKPETRKKEKSFYHNRSSDIRKKVNNPESIKEFIIISEILNKPKALRR